MKTKAGFSIIFLFLLLLLMTGVAAAAVPVACPTDNEWTGAVDADWSNSDNWDCDAVPDETTNVVIPATAANFPVADQTIHVENLMIDAGASFNLAGQLLIVDSKLTNNGTLIDQRDISLDGLPNGRCFFCTGGYVGIMLSRKNSPSDPGDVRVEIIGNQGTCDNENSTIGRCFDIQPTQTSNVSIDAIFYFLPAELNGLTCTQLQMYHWDGSGWSSAGNHVSNDCETSTDPEYNIRTDGITDFSPFAGSVGTPLAISLTGVDGISSMTPLLFAGFALLLGLLTVGIYINRRTSRL